MIKASSLLLAFLWGLAEATLFFIVPDVLLTWLAIHVSRNTALKASVFAALGAVAGGAVLLFWMQEDADAVVRAIIALPGINEGTLAAVRNDVSHDWLGALIIGAFTGVPYKLFAIKASETGLTASIFLLASFLARLPRFLLAAWTTDFLATHLRKRASSAWVWRCWLIWWLGFYTLYFYEMGW